MADRSELENLMADASLIPAAPGVVLELARSCRESDTSLEYLVAILKCDPSLTAKILRMANSAYFASRRQIADVGEAVVRLGLRRVQVMAMALCIMDATSGKTSGGDGFDFNYFWNHALVTGTFADVVANLKRIHLAVEAMVAGLLQDVGVLLLQTCMPDRYRPVLDAQKKSQQELHVIETRHMGFNHMQAGEMLLQRWHIPETISMAVGNHHQPEAVAEGDRDIAELAGVCQVGAAVAKYLTSDVGKADLLGRAVKLAGTNLEMSAEEMHTVLGLVRMRLEASAEMFGVRLEELMIRRLDATIRDRIAENVMEMTDTLGASL